MSIEDPSFEQKKPLEKSETIWKVGQLEFPVQAWSIGETQPEELGNPEVSIGTTEDALKTYADTDLITVHLKDSYGDPVPFAPFSSGNNLNLAAFNQADRQNTFLDANLILNENEWHPHNETVSKLWELARLKNPKTFSQDSTLACLRDLRTSSSGDLEFEVGPGKYSQGFYSMGSDGASIFFTKDDIANLLRQGFSNEHIERAAILSEELQHLHPNATTNREIISSIYDGNPPAFGEQAYNAVIGVGGIVLTSDNQFMFVNRGNGVSVNRGINMTASGGVDYDKDALSKYGFAENVSRTMAQETSEELNINSGQIILGAMEKQLQIKYGLENSEYDLIPVGCARELTRGGSPEFFFMVKYHRTAEELAKAATESKDNKEIDQFVYGLSAERTIDMIKTPGCTKVIHPKAVTNLMFINEYLRR